ncbi:MAG: hypothetical protein EXR71_06775 [Myxococcales bacterium]|nr:hypothetical protein [Myxococcales bacterium]
MFDVRALLSTAAVAQIPLHVISLRREVRVVGQLAEAGEDTLTVALPSGHGLEAMDQISASFSHAGYTHSFLAHVVEVDGDCVCVTAPARVVSADQRLVPRARVTIPIEVELLGAHPESRPVLVDLAVIGMQVTVSRPAGLALHERIPVVLAFEDVRIELMAELRRENGSALGFFFPESIQRGRLQPPPALAALVERAKKS